jgi:uncharacterized protein (TIGR02118 family)
VIRTVSFIQRRPDIDRSTFRRHYEEQHAPLARPHLAGLRHYVRNHVLAEHGGESVPFDAISEFEYIDRAAFDAMLVLLDSPTGDAIREDEKNFMHKPGNSFFAAERAALGPGTRPKPGTAAKAIATLRQAPSGAREALAARAREAGEELLASGRARYAELDTAQAGDPLGTPAWEVLLHLWVPADADAADVLGELRARLSGDASLHCLWIAEHGEPFPLGGEESTR